MQQLVVWRLLICITAQICVGAAKTSLPRAPEFHLRQVLDADSYPMSLDHALDPCRNESRQQWSMQLLGNEDNGDASRITSEPAIEDAASRITSETAIEAADIEKRLWKPLGLVCVPPIFCSVKSNLVFKSVVSLMMELRELEELLLWFGQFSIEFVVEVMKVVKLLVGSDHSMVDLADEFAVKSFVEIGK